MTELELVLEKAKVSEISDADPEGMPLGDRLELITDGRPKRTIRSMILEGQDKPAYTMTQTLYCRFGDKYAQIVQRGDAINHRQLETLHKWYGKERLHVEDDGRTKANDIARFGQLYRCSERTSNSF